jgi:hypothetical protein
MEMNIFNSVDKVELNTGVAKPFSATIEHLRREVVNG